MVQNDSNLIPTSSNTSDNNLPLPVVDPKTAIDQTATNSAGTSTNQPPGSNQPPLDRNTPEIAEDADLIEKEWVEKAKNIIKNAKSDPHLLNKEINKIKADYIKKRYNKDIKIDET